MHQVFTLNILRESLGASRCSSRICPLYEKSEIQMKNMDRKKKEQTKNKRKERERNKPKGKNKRKDEKKTERKKTETKLPTKRIILFVVIKPRTPPHRAGCCHMQESKNRDASPAHMPRTCIHN